MSIPFLPEEIFLVIVELLVLHYNDQRAPRLNTLRLVCRQWNELLQQTPSLWTYIWNGTNNTYVERALVRSKTLGLKVRVSHWKKVKNQNKQRFWSALLPHVDRWEHAELSGEIGDSIPWELARASAPRLQSLALDSHRWQVIDGLFPWPLPNLESLQIRDFKSPWSPQRFPSARLKHLYIGFSGPNYYGLGPPQLFSVLRECRELVSLHLSDIYVLGHEPWEGLAPVTLPNLEIISLYISPFPAGGKFLETIRVPKCRMIMVRHWSGERVQLEPLKSLAGRIGTGKVPNRAVLEAQETEQSTYLDCDLRAVDGGSLMRLKFEVYAYLGYDQLLEEVGPFLHTWVSSFGPNTGWDVRVASYDAASVDDMLSAFATHFPMALTLTIRDPVIPRSIAEPFLIRFDSAGDFAFPCLEELEIWYCKPFARGILQTISKRMIRGDTSRDGMTPLHLRIKIPKNMEEVERVELAWLGDQIATLTIQENTRILRDL